MANSSNASTPVENILKSFEDDLQHAYSELRGIPDIENVHFDLNNFWTNFSEAVKLISHEATKFSLAFEGEELISIEACQSLVEKFERMCLALTGIYATVPKAKGFHFRHDICLYVGDILQKVKQLICVIRNKGTDRVRVTGEVWEKCEAVEQLPRDNRDAVLAIFRQQHDMVQDALEELLDTIEHGDENSAFDLSLAAPLNGLQIPPVQSWSNSDRNVLLPCSGLIKALKACIKKIKQAITERGDGSSEGCINELDLIAEKVQLCSGRVDEFVLSLYPPMDHSLVRAEAEAVKNLAKDLLLNVKDTHICIAADQTWIEFLEKAADHNWVRIQDMALTE